MLEAGNIASIVQFLSKSIFMLVTLFIAYRLLHRGLRFRVIERLAVLSVLTHFSRWRRYRAPRAPRR